MSALDQEFNYLDFSEANVGPEVAASLAVLGKSMPTRTFAITIRGDGLAALLASAAIAGAPAVVVNEPAPAPVAPTKAPEPQTPAVPAHAARTATDAARFRRTQEETAAG